MSWKSGKPVAHLLQREIVEPLDAHPIRKLRELLAGFAEPKSFQRRVPKNYGNRLRVGQNPQNVVNQSGQVLVNGDYGIPSA